MHTRNPRRGRFNFIIMRKLQNYGAKQNDCMGKRKYYSRINSRRGDFMDVNFSEKKMITMYKIFSILDPFF